MIGLWGKNPRYSSPSIWIHVPNPSGRTLEAGNSIFSGNGRGSLADESGNPKIYSNLMTIVFNAGLDARAALNTEL
jgi:hypothetical protein